MTINAKRLADIEFKVFSQFGEDGIIQYLINKIPIENKFFIEFGVENYNESNTRFLLMNNNWSGLIIDGDEANINYVKKRGYYWKYDLTAVRNFITKENINNLITTHLNQLDVKKNIGLLSVDIDGVDYWVLKEIDCIEPSIIICEYNSLFGNDIPLTVPYNKEFVRGNYHYSNLYWGANLKAFVNLLSEKRYVYIGSSSQNSNAFFIKEELQKKYLPNICKEIAPFEIAKFRQSKDILGNLTFLRGRYQLKEIDQLPLLNTDNDIIKPIKEWL